MSVVILAQDRSIELGEYRMAVGFAMCPGPATNIAQHIGIGMHELGLDGTPLEAVAKTWISWQLAWI